MDGPILSSSRECWGCPEVIYLFGLTDWPRGGEGCDKCGWKNFLSEMDVLEKQLFEIDHKLTKSARDI